MNRRSGVGAEVVRQDGIRRRVGVATAVLVGLACASQAMATTITVAPYADEFAALFGRSSGGVVAYLPSNGDGTFGDVTFMADIGFRAGGSVADYDNDGDLDIVAGAVQDVDRDLADVWLFENLGCGTFEQIAIELGFELDTHPSWDSLGSFGTADFNDDGFVDFVLPSFEGNVHLFLNDGDNTFTRSLAIDGPEELHSAEAGDFNEDGDVDLVLSEYFAKQVVVYTGDGTGSFTRGTVTAVPNERAQQVSAGYLDADAHLDLIVTGRHAAAEPGGVFVYLGDGTGSFTRQTGLLEDDVTHIKKGDIFDFDRDGNDDWVFSFGGGYPPASLPADTGDIYLRRGNGDGTFQAAELIAEDQTGAFDPGAVQGEFVYGHLPEAPTHPSGVIGQVTFKLMVSRHRDPRQVIRLNQDGQLIDTFADGLVNVQQPLQGPDGLLYLVSLDRTVDSQLLRYDNAGDLLGVVADFDLGLGMAFGADGHAYISTEHNDGVIVVDVSTGVVSPFVSTGSGGLDAAYGLAFGGPDGNLFVVSRDSNEIIEYDRSTGAHVGNHAQLSSGQDLAFLNDDQYVATEGSNTLEMYSLTTGHVGTVVPLGVLTNPAGVRLGPDGDLYVVSFQQNKIHRCDATLGASCVEFAGLGSVPEMLDPFWLAFADVDADGDGQCDVDDPCPLDDPDDTDGDGVCDSDDPCPLDDPDDTDGDLVCDSDDNCPLDDNGTQDDQDEDGLGDACDDDADGDGETNATDCNDLDPGVFTGAIEDCDDGIDNDCDGLVDDDDTECDADGDGIPNVDDNCPDDPNPGQVDTDLDGDGDACDDDDDDDDGVLDVDDNCILTVNPGQEDFDGDTVGDACDADGDDDGVPDFDGDECHFTGASDTADGVPSQRLGKNRWADVDGDDVFDTAGNNPTGRYFDMDDTFGCNCAQIIAICGYGQGHTKFGCSNSVMDAWTGLYDEAGEPPLTCK